MIFYRAVGGLGDFLQMAESAILAKDILVISHSESGAKFFETLGVNVIGELSFQSIDELASVHNLGINLERKYRDHTAYEYATRETGSSKMREEIVIHPFGSKFSKGVDKVYNNKGKDFPVSFLQQLLIHVRTQLPNYPVRILGSEEQLRSLPKLEHPNILIRSTTIWEAIAYSYEAAWFIGADSFCKTARCMSNNIHRGYTLVEQKTDIFRDTHFIEPYQYHNWIFFRDLNDPHDAREALKRISIY